jgi:hypothetical protein
MVDPASMSAPHGKEIKPDPSDRTVKVIRHSDFPIEFTSKTRNRETFSFIVLLNRSRPKKGPNPLHIRTRLDSFCEIRGL